MLEMRQSLSTLARSSRILSKVLLARSSHAQVAHVLCKAVMLFSHGRCRQGHRLLADHSMHELRGAETCLLYMGLRPSSHVSSRRLSCSIAQSRSSSLPVLAASFFSASTSTPFCPSYGNRVKIMTSNGSFVLRFLSTYLSA